MPTRRCTLALTVASVAAMVAGCSSGDGDSLDVPGLAPTTTSTTTTTASTTTAPPASPPPAAAATTAAPTTTTPTTVATTAPPTTGPPTTFASVDGPYYRTGDEGPEVALIQLKLETIGFLEPGYTEGVFDGATNDAVVAFQGQYGLLVDGVVGPATGLALDAAAASVTADDT